MFWFRCFLAFCILFNFRIPIVYNSNVLAIFCSIVYYLLFPELFVTLFYLIKQRIVGYIFLGLTVVILLSCLPGLIHGTSDFYIVRGFILQFSLFLGGIIAYPIWMEGAGERQFLRILDIIICCFGAQSVIEIAGFIAPPIANVIHLFQKEEVAEIGVGFRALALSGNPFFDLAAGFGLCYLLFFYRLITEYAGKISISQIALFTLLVIGTFFAGRTGFVGLLIAVIYYFIVMGQPLYRKFLQFLTIFLLIGLGGLSIYWVLPFEIQSLVTGTLLPFAFEFLYSYFDEGTLTTVSTDMLSEMYFTIDWQTFIFGDGKYINPDGSYYLYTDAGYMRNILFYGIFGTMVLFAYHLLFFNRPIRISLSELIARGKIGSYNDLLFWLLLLIYTLVLHYKGEVVGFLMITQVMLFWLSLAYCKVFLKRTV
ncbi:hypothetical protein SAMN05444682_10759 [Parapedobacter indicus]|uniref:Oligosaccharide repeat unit polymerase n=1 Tax=Parapedobacter indicus TaxID=1477437 RepID=A0A1I3N0M1_9SPHI|nr:hypothetical protein CLV26_10759 [Parapedobacter indicus]SFJ02761.1 hypothetical protein SAMN05444682_10759 [Parapedobacter indicus]